MSDRDAEKFATAIRCLQPNNPVVLKLTGKILNKAVPGWHFACLDDTARNEAYQKALHALVDENSVVLDIGAGCGILSMMAAQAGAKHVYAVEISHLVAEAAREIISINGFEDRITVIEKDIMDVQFGTDIPEKCNLVVQDIIWPDPFSRGVNKFLQHAKAY